VISACTDLDKIKDIQSRLTEEYVTALLFYL
jgi:hypothetical protein